MVNYCNKFVMVNPGDTCDIISFWNGVGGGQWVKLWNGLSEDCSNLQVNKYACIGIIGGTPTTGANGVATPSPTHPGMVSNCNKFLYARPGDTCDGISFWNGVGGGQWIKLWNGVNEACSNLQVNKYVCIGVVAGTPTTSGNGIATPTPTHPGMMASNCNRFTKVNAGDTCDIISFFNGPISTGDFIVWNTGVGGQQCQNLQVNTYVCVGLITPTQPWNGIPTPQPTHPGMVGNCNKFVKVNSGDTCDIIAFFNGPISTGNFIAWNAGVGGAACTSLQANTYACIGVAA